MRREAPEHHHLHGSHKHRCHLDFPPARPGGGLLKRARWAGQWLCFVIFRNRFAIAVASLVWLIWRSGSQPRRLAYPCQQAAAANLGFLAVLFVPELARRHAARRKTMHRAVALATGCVALTGILVLLISAGEAVYSEWQANQALAGINPPANTPPPTTVAIVRSSMPTPNAAEVEQMVRQAVAKAGGLGGIVQTGSRVVIKPNLVMDIPLAEHPENGVTTDPRVVAAVVKLAKEAGAASVKIAEGTASSWKWSANRNDRLVTWSAYKKCGYDGNEDKLFDYDPSVELIDLNDAGTADLVPRPILTAPPNTVEIELPNGVIRPKYFVPKAILRPEQGGTCDVLINVPCLKNHGNAGITGALKNRVGCAPSDIYHATGVFGHDREMKRDLAHMAGQNDPFPRDVSGPNVPPETTDENLICSYTLVDLNLVRPNDFAVIDGLVGVTEGPTGDGNNPPPRANPFARLVIAGRDSVAVDTIETLVMACDPTKVVSLGWAWNRELGTLDTSIITVAGDHVADVRNLSFNCGKYGGTSCADLTPPTIGSVSIAEGATVWGDVEVTGSGLSGDVSKAELSVKLTAGPNLLVNGDFEEGATGWRTWDAATWGSGEFWDFDNAEEGRLGTKCLHVGTTAQSSLGVYQEVQVTPGKTYRVDGYWKGKRYGTWNWYEVLLIDGPFSMAQADDGGEPVVRANYMYAYDNYTYGLPADFGWLWMHTQNAPPDGQVDYNNRKGLRTATGNTMTVVLKCGAGNDTTRADAWFDQISLVEVGTSEELVDTLPHPTDPFKLTWHSQAYPDGQYALKVTVYDPELNEASITRNVVKITEPTPVIVLSTNSLTPTVHIGDCPAPQTFTIANGGIGTLAYKLEIVYAEPPPRPWLSVQPASGDSTGEADTITVSYDCTGLPPGTYEADLVVSDNGSTPRPPYPPSRKVAVTLTIETVRPDFDGDEDVDQTDFAHMQLCYTGSGHPIINENCRNADLDPATPDNDVDQNDFTAFARCLGQSNVRADRTCDDPLP